MRPLLLALLLFPSLASAQTLPLQSDDVGQSENEEYLDSMIRKEAAARSNAGYLTTSGNNSPSGQITMVSGSTFAANSGSYFSISSGTNCTGILCLAAEGDTYSLKATSVPAGVIVSSMSWRFEYNCMNNSAVAIKVKGSFNNIVAGATYGYTGNACATNAACAQQNAAPTTFFPIGNDAGTAPGAGLDFDGHFDFETPFSSPTVVSIVDGATRYRTTQAVTVRISDIVVTGTLGAAPSSVAIRTDTAGGFFSCHWRLWRKSGAW